MVYKKIAYLLGTPHTQRSEPIAVLPQSDYERKRQLVEIEQSHIFIAFRRIELGDIHFFETKIYRFVGMRESPIYCIRHGVRVFIVYNQYLISVFKYYFIVINDLPACLPIRQLIDSIDKRGGETKAFGNLEKHYLRKTTILQRQCVYLRSISTKLHYFSQILLYFDLDKIGIVCHNTSKIVYPCHKIGADCL